MDEARLDVRGAVPELDPHVQHLGREVPVGVSALAEAWSAPGGDPDLDARHVRLKRHRPFDRLGEARGRRGRYRDPKVLVEDPAKLDPGLEEERLAVGEAGPMDLRCGHGLPLDGGDGRGTVKGPRR